MEPGITTQGTVNQMDIESVTLPSFREAGVSTVRAAEVSVPLTSPHHMRVESRQ